MKGSKFKELVHLYLDGEIQPRDFRLLQRYLAQSEAHRNYFQQHCRLQRALSLAMHKGQYTTNGQTVSKRIRRRRAHRQRMPVLLGSVVLLILAFFMTLPTILVVERGGMDVSLDDHIRNIQGVVRGELPTVSSPVVTASVLPEEDLLEVASTPVASETEEYFPGLNILSGGVQRLNQVSAGSGWTRMMSGEIPGHSRWARDARSKVFRPDLF